MYLEHGVISGNVDPSITQSKLVLIKLNVQFSVHARFTTDEEYSENLQENMDSISLVLRQACIWEDTFIQSDFHCIQGTHTQNIYM